MNEEFIGSCGICKLGVKFVDDYAVVQEYIKGQLKSTGYYHRKCFSDRLKGNIELQRLQKKADWILSKVAEKVA